jgi:[NiFe] hydrogenase diaphorase moiety large subunit
LDRLKLESPNAVPAVDEIVREFGADPNRLMDIVLAVQRRFGYVSAEAIRAIASGVGRHVVDIEQMVSFYAFFDREPRGRCRIRLSKTPISLLKGAREVASAFETALGIPMGETTPDGAFTLDWTSDIGMADQEPAALIDMKVCTSLTPADVPPILDALRNGLSKLPTESVRSGVVKAGPLLSGPVGGDTALKAALCLSPDKVIEEITKSKLRGRGGAGFPTGMKWRETRKAAGSEHYVVCNADEGEPGTFKDRVLLAEFPDLVFDGMTIAGYAIGAHQGILYLRGEYTYLLHDLQKTLDVRRHAGLLGKSICGHTGFDFDIRIQLGAGAYICGEESALLESMEGKRGTPRDRPPFPTEHGYLQQPTVIDNVETLACATRILQQGSAWFLGFGTQQSSGTKLVCISGDCPQPGVYEVPFGITVNALLDLVGVRDAGYVQMSGPSGEAIAPKDFGRTIAYEDLSTGGSTMIFDENRDVLDVALQFADFFVDESCGWCAPCRVGTQLLKRELQKVVAGRATLSDIGAIDSLAQTVARMSRCGLGQTAPNPILTTLRNFPEVYEARLRPELFVPAIDLHDALRDAVGIQGREPIIQAG